VPTTTDVNKWLKKFSSRALGKNSCGLVIRQVQDRLVRWACTIVSLYLATADRASDVTLTMLEAIGEITKFGKEYNWVEHVTNLIKAHCQDCQNSGKAICFLCLLIWLAMNSSPLVGEEDFKNKDMPLMNNFRILSLLDGETSILRSP